MNMTSKFGQDELQYVYESAKSRMEAHPDIADKNIKIINEYPYFTTLDDAIKYANAIDDEYINKCQIWAKVGKDEEYYYIQGYFITTDDVFVSKAAEYIGMEQIK